MKKLGRFILVLLLWPVELMTNGPKTLVKHCLEYITSVHGPLNGRAVRRVFGLAGSYCRYANPHGPPTPIGVGERISNLQ